MNIGKHRINVPMIKPRANPTLPLRRLRDVAVVRWSAGNHVAEMSEGAAMHTGAARPFSTWPPWINLAIIQTKPNPQIIHGQDTGQTLNFLCEIRSSIHCCGQQQVWLVGVLSSKNESNVPRTQTFNNCTACFNNHTCYTVKSDTDTEFYSTLAAE